MLIVPGFFERRVCQVKVRRDWEAVANRSYWGIRGGPGESLYFGWSPGGDAGLFRGGGWWDGEGEPASVAGEGVGEAVGPFDDGDGGFVEDVVPAKAGEFGGVLEAVEVEVMDGCGSRRPVFVDECEGGAGDVVGVTERGDEGGGECGFARAEGAAEGEGVAGLECGGELVGEGGGGRFVSEVDG